jgi:adenine-specific DNA methylase
MIPSTCKRLIEVDFPIAAVSAHSAREKSIRHGHPSTLHLWWARRPLAACRSVLLGLLLPDPCDQDCPADFKTTARELLAKRYSFGVPPSGGKGAPDRVNAELQTSDDLELRELLLKFIGEFANWDHAANAMYLEIGRGLVKAAHPEETPVVVDPFAGGGSIPLEALRLGCETFASDLNPVACLILKTMLEDIPRYGNAEFRLPRKFGVPASAGQERGEAKAAPNRLKAGLQTEDDFVVIHGLADALRHVGKQVKAAAEKELAQFYPPDSDGNLPIAYLWARTVRCEGIGCGAEIPLVRSFWLCKKSNRKQAFRYRVERPKGKPPHLTFEIFTPKSESALPNGTVHRADATCPCCHIVLPASRVRSQLAAQRGGADAQFDAKGHRTGGAMLLAVVSVREDTTGRFYRLPTPEDYVAVFAAQKAVAKLPKGMVPNEALPPKNTNCFRIPNYGMKQWCDVATARQKLALATLAQKSSAFSGINASEVFAIPVSRCSDFNSSLNSWAVDGEFVRSTFARQALSMVWDFCETMPLTTESGGYNGAVEWVVRVVEALGEMRKARGQVQLADACKSPLPDAAATIWFTDPPYYDAVGYAELSDFFFVWLKRALPNHPFLKDPFDAANTLTPKFPECVQDEAYRSFNGVVKDRDFFESRMALAFAQGRRVLREDGVGCVVFAHKTTEGWEALLSGMLKAGLTITTSWPISTERPVRFRAQDSAALAGSVHLVCRPRPADAGIGDWTEVKAAMEKRIREWLPTLLKHGVRGADAIFSCLGPALESYSKFEKVLTAGDREVPLGGDPDAIEPEQRGFLAYVFETLSKEALRQILGDAPSGETSVEGFEEDARLSALFLWTLQATKANGNGGKKSEAADEAEDETSDDEDDGKPKKAKAGFSMPFDTFIRITRPMGIHYAALEHRVIEIEKGIVRLLPVRERSEQLLGEAATRPGIEITLEDVKQLELGLATQRREEAALMSKPKRGQKSKPVPGKATADVEFTTLDRLHRAMLLFGLGRSTLLRQVLETELRQSKRFERLALALNALYPDGSDERRMLEGVQAAMRGVK